MAVTIKVITLPTNKGVARIDSQLHELLDPIHIHWVFHQKKQEI